MSKLKEIRFYVALERGVGKVEAAYIIKSDLDSVKKIIDARAKSGTIESSENQEATTNIKKKVEAKKAFSFQAQLAIFSRQALRYYDLIGLIRQVTLQQKNDIGEIDIIASLISSKTCIEERAGYSLFEVGYNDVIRMMKTITKKGRALQTSSLLEPSALLSMVAQFDSSVADLIRDMLSSKSDRFPKVEKSISLQDILAADSLQDLVDHFVSEEVYKVLRGSHDEQVKYIESTFNVEIRGKWPLWPDFLEVFERRNLLAHGEKSFTKRYMSNFKNGSQPKSLGGESESILVSHEYLENSADLLVEFGILTIFKLWLQEVVMSASPHLIALIK